MTISSLIFMDADGDAELLFFKVVDVDAVGMVMFALAEIGVDAFIIAFVALMALVFGKGFAIVEVTLSVAIDDVSRNGKIFSKSFVSKIV
jgi:hypothetical protein